MALSADLLSADNFNSIKGILKKRNKTGLGLEFLVSKARTRQSSELAKWFTDLKEAQRFCESSGCQFILSSGAQNSLEMVSARSLEAIINEIGIDTKRYWQDLHRWLDYVLARKVILA
jgi:RNase P/RNase MRP subunit p30